MVQDRSRSPFVDWALGVSIRTKIMGIALGVAVFLGLGVTWELNVTFMRTLREETEAVGIYAARNAVKHAEAKLLARNRAALRDVAQSFAESNRSVRYVVFRDNDGRVLAHTFVGPVPAAVLALPAVGESPALRIAFYDGDGGPVRDIAMRPLRRDVGWVQVGVTEDWFHDRLVQMTSSMLVASLFVALGAMLAAYLLTGILTRPLRDLTEVAAAVAKGDFAGRAAIHADDEIGQLSRVLNLMCERLTVYREEIEHKEHMRAELLQQVITAQEEERKRVARELHDHTSQSLTSLAVELKALETATDMEETRVRTHRLREIVAQTLEGVHQLSLELRPTLLDDLGLVAAIEHHVEELQNRLQLPVDFQALGSWETPLSPEVEITLYRICQEALTNATRHADAERLSVVLTRRHDSVVAIVEDDGKGFLVDEVFGAAAGEENLGLFGMQERAALVRGKLTIESAPGLGTTVFVEIPCPAPASEARP
jgi:signal transduction histidine kinase